jgi:hypothetical protein
MFSSLASTFLTPLNLSCSKILNRTGLRLLILSYSFKLTSVLGILDILNAYSILDITSYISRSAINMPRHVR